MPSQKTWLLAVVVAVFVITAQNMNTAFGASLITDMGPLSLSLDEPQTLSHPAEAFRVQSFGKMPIQIDVSGSAHPHIMIEGPLPNYGDSTEPGNGPIAYNFEDTKSATATLTSAGVYRIIVEADENEKATVTSQCLNADLCHRPEMSNQELLKLLRDHKELDIFLNVTEKKIDEFVDNPKLRILLFLQLKTFVQLVRPEIHKIYDHLLTHFTFADALHFPTLGVKYLPLLRPLAYLHTTAPNPDEVIKGDLRQLAAQEGATRTFPTTIAGMPDLQNGDFPDLTLTKTQVAHSHLMARVLTSLAANNGSQITLDGKTLTTPDELMKELIQTGHTVTLRNERTYASFIDFSSGGRTVRWPVWLGTNGKLPHGQQLSIPMGHSQLVWIIQGPVINAKITFFLGISGASFFSEEQMRPPWTGLRPVYILSTSNGQTQEILNTFHVAAIYLRRTRIERNTVAKGMAADGYGYVGVCNDSTAVIEYLTHGTISSFPLARAAKLDKAPRLNDGLDDVMRLLPHDLDHPPTQADLYKRVFESIPFSQIGDELQADPSMAGKMVEPALGFEMNQVSHALGFE